MSINRQVELLEISHSNLYYLPRSTFNADLALMRHIDELHLNYPFGGSRMLRDMLRLEGHQVGREHVRTLMAKMGIHADETTQKEPLGRVQVRIPHQTGH